MNLREQLRRERETKADLLTALKDMRAAMSALVMGIVMGRPLQPIEAQVNAAQDAANAAIARAEGAIRI